MFIDKEAGVILTLANPVANVEKLTVCMERAIKAGSIILEEVAPTIEESIVVEKTLEAPKKATKKKTTEKAK